MTECPHGTYYPVEPCNPCGLEDGVIRPVISSTGPVGRGFAARFTSKCPACGDPIEPGDRARKIDYRTCHEGCVLEEMSA